MPTVSREESAAATGRPAARSPRGRRLRRRARRARRWRWLSGVRRWFGRAGRTGRRGFKLPLPLAAARAVVGLPDRACRSSPGARPTRSTRSRRAAGPATNRARPTSWSAATHAPGLTAERAQEAPHRQRRRSAHRHDRADPHRQRTHADDVDPPRLAGRRSPATARPRSTRRSRTAGPKLLIKTIEQDTGIHIDHYVEIGLGGFVNIVDAVDGITICPRTAWTTSWPTCT